MMVGSFKEAKEASPELKEWAKKFKVQVENKLNKKFDSFEALQYTTQVVAGTNYRIKYQVGSDQYIHVKVHKPLPTSNSIEKVLEIEEGKTLEDAI